MSDEAHPFNLFPSGSTPLTAGAVDSANMVDFNFGITYKLSPQIVIRGGIDVIADSLDMTSNGGATVTTIGHRIIAISPALLYYF